jgi:geranylgeranylglycerol-phosphate geranylgeranyltransferase
VCMNERPTELIDAVTFDANAVQAALAVALVWVFSVVNNNVHDLEIDRINAPERPLVSGTVDRASYEQAGSLAFLLALGLAAWIHSAALVTITIFGLGYFVYSSPPLRLKENCGVSKLVIGLNSLLCVVLGASLLSGKLDIPRALAWGVFVWFSLGAHLIDLKDIEGDRAAGIRNVSTMLGLRRAQLVIGGSAVLGHVVIAYLVRDSWIALPIVAVGALQLWFVTRTPFRETPVLVLQNAVTVAFIARALSG